MTKTTHGSQRLLQIAVEYRPELLRAALRRSGALGRRESIERVSPLAGEEFREYRDGEALRRMRVTEKLDVALRDFWPARGAVWDALAIAGEHRPLLLEAKPTFRKLLRQDAGHRSSRSRK